ncbi:YdcF family protein [Lactococcus fujiensis]|uniref:YdcF family protein n=1 Tax=Lactococcus fujiensis TaxID=610251 RepID=UPI000A9D4E09|nr:YdcF family protein [Lactococcus fujiensis]
MFKNLRGKLFFKFLVACLLIVFFYLGICFGLVLTKINDRPQNLVGYDTILVLRSQINGKTLATSYPATVTQNRLDAAIKIAHKNPSSKLIVSGYQGSNEFVREADGMARYLENNGISATRIIKEEKARNTYENLANSKHYFRGKVIVVTSDFHLERSLILAKKQHLRGLTGYAAPTTIKQPFLYTGYYGHEVLGLARALILGK